MGWMELLASLVSSLAWPIAAVGIVAVVFLSGTGKDLIRRLTGVKAFGFDISFVLDLNREIEQAAIEVIEADPSGTEMTVGKSEKPPEGTPLVHGNDTHALSGDLDRLELVLRQVLGESTGEVPHPSKRLQQVAGDAQRAGLLTSGQVRAIEQAMSTRNRLVHGREVADQEVEVVTRVVEGLTSLMRLRLWSFRKERHAGPADSAQADD